MAENGVVEKLLENENEGREGESSALLDPCAAAMAMDAARYDKELSRKAGEYFDEQRSLVRHQLQHFDAERVLAIEASRRKAFSDRLRIAVQLFFLLLTVLVGVGGGVMLWDACTSRSVVVESFEAPPALVAQGLNGKVVASSVLDALQKLQSATRTDAAKLDAKSAWSSEVKIEVPETGMSIGELGHILHQRFGHDIRIEGDVVTKPDGMIELTVRGEGIPAKRIEGPAAELEALTVQAAEYIYGQAQPAQFSRYLNAAGRRDDALKFIPEALTRAKPAEEAELFNSWGNVLTAVGRNAEAAQKYRIAVKLAPDNWKSWGNLVGLLPQTESEEASVREGKAMVAAIAQRGAKLPDLFMVNVWSNVRDFASIQKANLADAASHDGTGSEANTEEAPIIADYYGYLHDYVEAKRWLEKGDAKEPTVQAERLLAPAYPALEAGKPDEVLAGLEQFWAMWQREPLVRFAYPEQACMLGLAYGLTGALDKAEEVFKHAGAWSYCYGLHGVVLEHAGKLQEAQAVWAEGLRVGPSLSPVYLYRGISAMQRNELKLAEADLAAASERSPHWADPLKSWGDLLARQGRWKDALQKYEQALQYAPAWQALIQARDMARSKA